MSRCVRERPRAHQHPHAITLDHIRPYRDRPAPVVHQLAHIGAASVPAETELLDAVGSHARMLRRSHLAYWRESASPFSFLSRTWTGRGLYQDTVLPNASPSATRRSCTAVKSSTVRRVTYHHFSAAPPHPARTSHLGHVVPVIDVAGPLPPL